MRAGFIQLERWGVLPLCRACGGRPVHPVRAGGVLKAGLLYRQDWSKPWSSQTLPRWGCAPRGVGSSQILVGQKQLSC